MDLPEFSEHLETALRDAFGLTDLVVDPDGDWPFDLAGQRVFVRVQGEPDLHAQVFTRVATAVAATPETFTEVNRLNSVMTCGALVLTDDSTIVATMRLHRSMITAEALRVVITAMSSYGKELGPLFEVVHGGGMPFPRPTTPEAIEQLDEGHVFVFGSNVRGSHGGGAARVARERFGAIDGIGEGLQGQSYALPTMEGLDDLAAAAGRFVAFARSHPELTFWLTRVGCGIAGHSDDEVKGYFADAPHNVVRPPDW